MGILKGIFKSRDKPKNATSGSAYRFFIGGSSIGKNVNERSAMQMTAVYSCVRICQRRWQAFHFMCTNITQRVERERLLHCIP